MCLQGLKAPTSLASARFGKIRGQRHASWFHQLHLNCDRKEGFCIRNYFLGVYNANLNTFWMHLPVHVAEPFIRAVQRYKKGSQLLRLEMALFSKKALHNRQMGWLRMLFGTFSFITSVWVELWMWFFQCIANRYRQVNWWSKFLI